MNKPHTKADIENLTVKSFETIERCDNALLTLIPLAKHRVDGLENEIEQKQTELNELNELHEYYTKIIAEATILQDDIGDLPDYRYI